LSEAPTALFTARTTEAATEVIEHVDLQNPGSFGQPASQPDISFARRRIA
jgi:hypothetical protein